jgi:predicted aspartyl protease
MKPSIIISRPQTLRAGLFHKNPVNYYITHIDAFVTNPANGVRSDLPKRFLIDTGAALTILNRQFNRLFEDGQTPEDTTEIMYGGGLRKLPVYEVELKIDGHSIKVLAAHDDKMALDSLLGHYNFLNDFDSFNLSGKRRNFRLIKS